MTDAAPTTTAAPAGQAADAAAAAAAAPAPVPAAPVTNAADPNAPPAAEGAAAPDPNAEPWKDPEAAKRVIEQLRRENGDARINAKAAAADEARAEMAKALLKIIDPNAAAGDEVTPEQLLGKLNDTTGALTQERRDNAIARAALEARVDPSKLAYLEFTLSRDTALATIAPDSADFGATLKARIEAAIAADPSIKTPGAVTTTGAEGFAGSNDPQAVTKAQYDAMSLIEKSALLQRDPDTYRRLAAESY